MNEISEIGNDLVGYAVHEAEFSAQRGLLDNLFPFIYVASKRMSLRAICRWLAEKHRVQISPNAVAKAMRDQETYWAQLVEDVEPAARTFAEAHDTHPFNILDNEDYFESLETKPPVITADDGKGIESEFRLVADAAGVLRNRWFPLPEEARNQCRRHFVGVFAVTAENETGAKQEGGKDESGK